MKLIKLILLCLIPLSVFAEASQELMGLLTHVKTIQASFSQRAVGVRGPRLGQNSIGKMAIAKPMRFRWDIMFPSRQIIVGDGKKLWIYNVDLRQVTVQPIMRALMHSPAMILSGDLPHLLEHYSVTRLATVNTLQGYRLHAKNRNETYGDIDIYFSQGQIANMHLVDNLKQQSMIYFSAVKINGLLNPAIFTFNPPRGVDVVFNP